MLTSGDVIDVDLGAPVGREAGYRHPAVLVTAQRILDGGPNVVHVVPLTSTVRRSASEVVVEADELNGLDRTSSAQCQHVRAAAVARVGRVRGSVGPAVLSQVRDVLGLLLDVPG